MNNFKRSGAIFFVVSVTIMASVTIDAAVFHSRLGRIYQHVSLVCHVCVHQPSCDCTSRNVRGYMTGASLASFADAVVPYVCVARAPVG